MNEKTYTRNWFRNRNLITFEEYIKPQFAGKRVVYLEIGVFEAMSLCWMMDNVLTHPDSQAVGIDPWVMVTKIDEKEMELVRGRAIANTMEYGKKCKLFRATSPEILRTMIANRYGFGGICKNSVDLCMIDGNHNALAVLDDARLVYQLMRPNGWILFDDVVNKRTKEDHVREGVDLFLGESHGVELVWKHNHMECYKKI